MTWLWALAPWSGVAAIWLVIRHLERRRRHAAGRLEALADLTREPATLTDLIAAPCLVVWQCGCRPCPAHAAAQLARERAARIRAQWASDMHRETGL